MLRGGKLGKSEIRKLGRCNNPRIQRVERDSASLAPVYSNQFAVITSEARAGLVDASRVSDYFSQVQEDDRSCRHIRIILQHDGDFPSRARLLRFFIGSFAYDINHFFRLVFAFSEVVFQV